jgi:YNFM family putative membrane transporter
MTQPIFPQIAASLEVSGEDARFAFFVASMAYALAFFIFGPLSDRCQPRTLAGAGTAILAVIIALATTTTRFSVFVALMAAAGIAAAAVPAAMYALMPRIAPEGMIGVYFGLIIGATVAGITLGRSFTGVVAGWIGWHTTVLLLAGLNVFSLGLLLFLPKTAETGAAQVPVRQAYTAAVKMFVDLPVVRLLVIGVLLFFGYLGVVTFLTFRLHQAPFRYDPTAIGWVSLIGLIGLIGAPLAGRMITRIGPQRVVLIGLGTVVAGMVALGLASQTLVVAAGVLLVFLGVFSCQPAVLVILAGVVTSERRGTASSIYVLCCLCAGSASSAVLGPIWTRYGWTTVVAVGVAAVVMAGLLTLLATRPERIPAAVNA